MAVDAYSWLVGRRLGRPPRAGWRSHCSTDWFAFGSVVCTDSTSINLYKAVVAAAQLVEGDILTDSGNFPSDLYVLGSVAELLGRRLRIVEPEQIMDRWLRASCR